MIQQFQKKRGIHWAGEVQRVIDALFISAGFVCVHYLYSGAWNKMHVAGALMSTVVYLAVSGMNGVYQRKDRRLRLLGYGSIVSSWIITTIILLALAYLFKATSSYSRVAVSAWFILMPAILIFLRIPTALIFNRTTSTKNVRRAALAGYNDQSRKFLENARSSPELDINVEGIYTSDAVMTRDEIPTRGDFQTLIADVKRGLYDEVYIALDPSEEEAISTLIAELGDTAVPVYFIPNVFTMNLLVSQFYHLNEMPIISIYDSPMDAGDIAIKRAEDVVLSILIIIISAIPMLLVAVMIKLTSKGPVIFKQRRYGLGGAPIEVWKFRSMTACDDGEHIVQASKNDPRLTRIGAFLRKSSLDELPQFFNVLMGDMSIVGPRPHAIAHNELYRKEIKGYMLRHLVKPGITGWAQVNGWRGETDTLEKMEMRVKFDLEYIKCWSLWFDLKIILLTLVKGFLHKNAY